MAVERSFEIESVARRVLRAWQVRDQEMLSNLISGDAGLRIVGSDEDERWIGPDQFFAIFEAQSGEMPDWDLEIGDVEGFEDGSFGWVTAYSRLVMPERVTQLRHSAVFRLEAGVWRVIQWHNSIPVSNAEVFGVELTTTLDELVASVLDDAAELQPGSEGTMSLVFTDIVDSTPLAAAVGDTSWADLIKSHERQIRRITDSHGGSVVKFLGDGSMLAFESAREAVRAAVEIRQSASKESFGLRVGIHTGEVVRTGDDLFGMTVNKAARVASAAKAGQVMVSSTTRDLVGSMEGIAFGQPTNVALKGLQDTHQIIPVELL
jgi:adenylate cyclase